MGTAPLIIDVDAHVEPAPGWLDDFPDLAARLPHLLPDTDPRFALGTAEMFAWFVSDDLLRGVPREERMPIDRLVNPAIDFLFTDDAKGLTFSGADQYAPLTDPAARVAWLDAQGIAKQNLISGGGYTLARAIEDPGLSRDAVQAVNTWMTDAVGEHRDRLLPVACLRFDDIDWAGAELRWVRERGSRTFLISSEPVGGVPPSSPAFDPVWAAATELGMVPLLHIGMSPAMLHPGWANVEDPGLIRLLSVLQPSQSAEVFLTAIVIGGVFERHPDLTILISELLAHWWHRYDEGQIEELRPYLTPDATFRTRTDTGTTDWEEFVRADFRGADEIIYWQVKHRAASPHPLRHMTLNVAVDRVDGTAADFRSYLLVTQVVGGNTAPIPGGVLTGTAVRTEDGLQLSHFELTLDTQDSIPLEQRG